MRAAAEVKSQAIMTGYRSVIPPALFDPQRVTPDRLEAEWNEDFDQLTDDGRILVAKDADGSIIGVCLCRLYDNALPARLGYIGRLFVLPEWWSNGVGGELMHRAVEFLASRGFREALLHVMEKNTRARHFYVKRGWRFECVAEQMDIGSLLQYRLIIAASERSR